MAFSSGGNRRALAEINVTPLVDVMLVLLIIFMVAAPLLQTGVKIDLPKEKTPEVQSKKQPLVLAIQKVGDDYKLYLGDTEIPKNELGEKLSTNMKLKQDRTLYIRADQSLKYGVVIQVMSLAQAAGVESIGMITAPPEVP